MQNDMKLYSPLHDMLHTLSLSRFLQGTAKVVAIEELMYSPLYLQTDVPNHTQPFVPFFFIEFQLMSSSPDDSSLSSD